MLATDFCGSAKNDQSSLLKKASTSRPHKVCHEIIRKILIFIVSGKSSLSTSFEYEIQNKRENEKVGILNLVVVHIL
jgi:hypothetical protein